MTMESYDPSAYDFPRNVNEAMVHVLSSTSATIQEEDDVPSPAPIPRDGRGVSEGFGFDEDVDAPPTYDQVTSEMSNERVQEQPRSVASPTNDAPRPPSPPPAFEPEARQASPIGPRPPHSRSNSGALTWAIPVAPDQSSSPTLPAEGHAGK
jgi:hypothetical protein